MTPLPDLISRLQAATGPDRELDIDIATACLPMHHSGRWSMITAPRFTASIDAALTLVPEGWNWLLTKFDGYQPTAEVEFKGTGFHAAPEIGFEASGPTLAIALCIAALKAIAAKTPGEAEPP